MPNQHRPGYYQTAEHRERKRRWYARNRKKIAAERAAKRAAAQPPVARMSGRQLRKLREARGLSQAAFAAALGEAVRASERSVRRWEAAARVPAKVASLLAERGA